MVAVVKEFLKEKDGNHVTTTTFFSINSSTAAEDWLEWELAWNTYNMATGANEKTQASQLAMLISMIGAEARRVYHTAHFEADQRHELEPVIQMYRDYVHLLANITMEKYKFNARSKKTKKVLTSMLLSSDN